MEGYQVTMMDEAASQGDVLVTATGNVDVITIDHIRHMQHRPFRRRDPDRRLARLPPEEVKPQVDEVIRKNCRIYGLCCGKIAMGDGQWTMRSGGAVRR
jgi:hypothetical protein